MNLKEYIERNYIPPAKFALELGVNITAIYRYMRGGKPPLLRAHKIVDMTNGAVTLEDLRGSYAEKQEG